MATRPTPADPFGPATLVTEIDPAGTSTGDGDPDLSRDGRTLMFASQRPGTGGFDLFALTRACQ
jgi:hypothetical protein